MSSLTSNAPSQQNRAGPAQNVTALTEPARGEINVLGEPALRFAGQFWQFPAKAFAIVAILATRPSAAMTREQLRLMLWGNSVPSRANASLRQTLARVKATEDAMGGRLLIPDGHGIAFNRSCFTIDIESCLATDLPDLVSAKNRDVLAAIAAKRVEDLLPAVSALTPEYEEWKSATIEAMRRNCSTALRALVADPDLARSPADREKHALRLLELDPTSEFGYRALMQFYDKQGERARALQVYQRCRAVLRDELGVEPELATRSLAVSMGFLDFAGTTAVAVAEGRPSHGPNAMAIAGAVGEAGKPTVFVLDPLVVFADAEARALAVSLLEDVVAGLARFRSFSVVLPQVSRLTSDMAGSARRLGGYAVNTLIKPSVRGYSLGCRLTERETGKVIWASEYPFDAPELSRLFGLLSQTIVYSLADTLEAAELALPFAPRNATAFRLYLEGRSALKGIELRSLRRARSLFRKAIAQEGRFAPAYSGMARSLSMERLVRGLTENSLLMQSLAYADRASQLDPFDARGMRERGFTCLYLHRHDESLFSFRRALELNPNDPDIRADYADALAHAGRPEEALAEIRQAMQLRVRTPEYYLWIFGSILYQMRKYDEAIATLEPVKDNSEIARLLAACFAMLGKLDRARGYTGIFMESYPEFRLSQLERIVPDRYERDKRHFIDGLRRAGFG